MNSIVTVVSLALGIGFLAVSDIAKGHDDIVATSFDHNVDASLVYIDLLKRPATSGAYSLLASTADDGVIRKPRALGLERLRLGLTYQAANVTGLTVVFRPDAVSAGRNALGDDVVRDFDSRAGDTYRQAPAINLLDAYHFTAVIGPNLEISYGVYEQLATQALSYPLVMEFGLNVRLPSRVSGLLVSWRQFALDQVVAAGDGLVPTGIAANVYVFQGDQDRSEKLGSRESTFDVAPTSEDPYIGAAVQFDWIPASGFAAGLLGGFADGVEGAGKRHEVFLQGTAAGNTRIRGRQLRYSLDLRWARETFRAPSVNMSPREQGSAALTFSTPASTKTWYLLGVHLGKSERYEETVSTDLTSQIDGYQVETGLLGEIGKGLTAVIVFNHEMRKIIVPGSEKTGAFSDDDGSHGTLKRFALKLRYLLDDVH